jgi:aspartyl/glutamyl-tRNA(Asn/Gln) amidotransferase C subunit
MTNPQSDLIKFSQEDLLKLAELSSLKIYDDEISYMQDQIAKTLSYIEQLVEFQARPEHDAVKTINVFREDKATPKEAANILAQAPQTKETYFVVPKILDR